jgi:glycerol-3-phosphate acyltransferase PlsX
MPIIAVDAMGGDRGPAEVVAGALAARGDTLTPILYGDAAVDPQGLELVETHGVIEMHAKPADAVRAKPDSSLVASVRAVREGKADAVVSAGNTGAMLAAGLLELRRIPGVLRPAIAVPIPAQSGPSVLIDAGANADARPEQLVQFATMGAVFAEEILGLKRPTVRLLSIGEEEEKGNQLTLETHSLLRESDLNFLGNCEGRDVLRGAADVVVTDGFTGNVVLKTMEGTIRTILEGLRDEITATTRGKLGGLMIRPAARRLRHRLDPDTYGGAYLLGLRGLAVVAHGNSSRTAIASAIRLAARGVDNKVVERLEARLKAGSDGGEAAGARPANRGAPQRGRPMGPQAGGVLSARFHGPRQTEVTWQRRVTRCTRRSRRS